MTWDNLLAERGDGGIINMEDDEDELSDTEMGGPAGGRLAGISGGLAAGIGLAGLGGLFGGAAAGGGAGSTSADASGLLAGLAGAPDGQTPFDDLRDLMCHHAHLAVFLNYVVSNSDPASLVSTIGNLNSYCIMRHMHYEFPRQCFLIEDILSSTKENNYCHFYSNKKVLALFSHICVNRLDGKS